MFGVVGMIVSVPLLVVIKMIIGEYIDSVEEKKQMKETAASDE